MAVAHKIYAASGFVVITNEPREILYQERS